MASDDKPNFYLSNKSLLEEISKCKIAGDMSSELATMLQLLCSRIARRGNFINYPFNEDMQAYAMLSLVRTWKGFNPEKSNNPFAFYSQCIHNSYKQYIKVEKKQRRVKDELLISEGLNPSFYYEEDDTSNRDEIQTSDDPISVPASRSTVDDTDDDTDIDQDDAVDGSGVDDQDDSSAAD